MPTKNKIKRGSVRKSDSEFFGLWIPKPLAALIDEAVRRTDTDRSKFIRTAVRRAMEGAQ